MATNRFLANKGFHPNTKANRTKVFEAEQRAARQEKEIKEREAVLKREREVMADGRPESGKQSLAFMYSQPMLVAETSRQQQQQQEVHDDQRRHRGKGKEGEWCRRCNVRGHQETWDQCPLRNKDVAEAVSKRLEDPLEFLERRKRELLQEGAVDGGHIVHTFYRQVDPNDPNNQMLDMSDGGQDEDDGLRVEREFLASLSAEDREMLIRHFKRQHKKERKKEKKDKKKEKKEKKKQKID